MFQGLSDTFCSYPTICFMIRSGVRAEIKALGVVHEFFVPCSKGLLHTVGEPVSAGDRAQKPPTVDPLAPKNDDLLISEPSSAADLAGKVQDQVRSRTILTPSTNQYLDGAMYLRLSADLYHRTSGVQVDDAASKVKEAASKPTAFAPGIPQVNVSEKLNKVPAVPHPMPSVPSQP